jgi:hypothetical protein
MRLMQRVRDSIKNDTFPEFVKNYVRNYYSNKNNNKNQSENEQQNGKSDNKNDYNIPEWVVNSLMSVNINVLD